jgi:HK97 gp10 family phage protein
MSVQISVEGMDRLRKALQRLPERARKYVSEEMYWLAVEALEVARSLAPVRTGYLRSTIHWVEDANANADEGGYWLVATAPYARYQEFGTRYIRARLFMTAAWWHVMQESRRLMRKVLDRILEEGSS